MNKNMTLRKLILSGLAASALATASVTTQAADFFLCAAATTKTMPDTGEVVTMWGFAQDDNANLADGCGTGVVQIPGPMLTVPVGDNVVNINVLNNLTDPVSVVIPGQVTSMTPVMFTDAQGRNRVRSLTTETAPSATGTYTWSNFKPGSFIYQSGTHQAVQVQMGLYGGLKKDDAAGQAYPGVAYDNEVELYYSEIDPALHAAVASGNYGPASTIGMTSTIDYKPRYFLVNGEPYSAATASIAAGYAGQRTLIRFFNMGLRTVMPILRGMDMSVVAEDGNLYPYAREQYSVMLAAAKTKDAIITPSAPGSFAIFDHTLSLTNSQLSPGGFFSMLAISGAPTVIPPSDTVTILRARFNAANLQLRVWANSDNSAANLSVIDPNTNLPVPMTTYVTDPNVLNGGFYRLFVANVTANPGTVTVNSDQGGTDTEAVPFTEPPVANADTYTTAEDTVLSIASAGVLTNDLKGGWVANDMQAVVTTPPTNGTLVLNIDGSFDYTPNANFHGSDSFAYVVNMINATTLALLDTSAPATVDITVNPVNDAPVAVDDAYSVDQNTALNVAAAGVLANDTDVDSDPMTAILAAGPANGTVTLNADGSFSYTPVTNFVGTDSFTYQANDGTASGNIATVTITVNAAANQPPVAVNDFASTALNTSVAIDVLANDTDPDNNIDPSTVTIVVQPTRGGTVSVDPVTGVVTFTPALNFRGTDVFRYTVSDTAGATSNRGRVRVNIR